MATVAKLLLSPCESPTCFSSDSISSTRLGKSLEKRFPQHASACYLLPGLPRFWTSYSCILAGACIAGLGREQVLLSSLKFACPPLETHPRNECHIIGIYSWLSPELFHEFQLWHVHCGMAPSYKGRAAVRAAVGREDERGGRITGELRIKKGEFGD